MNVIRGIQWALTVVTVILAGIFQGRVYENSDLIRGRAGAAQLSDDPGTIIAVREALRHDYSWVITLLALAFVLAAIWLSPAILRAIGLLPPRDDRDPPSGNSPYRSLFLIVGLLLFAPVLVGCGGASTRYAVYNVGPSETVFAIPATETGQQAKLQSEKYLLDNQVAARQLTVTYTRYYLSNASISTKAWKADTLYYIVDRSPVSRQWTADASTGTEAKDQSFKAESNEAIDFSVGGACTGSVPEDQAAKFLYNFSGSLSIPVQDEDSKDLPPSIYKQAAVAQVLDNQVHTFFQTHLFQTFHSMPLDKIRQEAGSVFKQIADDATEYFGARGLKLEGCGGVGGITFTDPKVQETINATFAAQQEQLQATARGLALRQQAEGEYAAQDLKNKTLISQAAAAAEAAKIKAKGEADAMAAKGAVLAQNPGIIELIRAEKYKGDVPSTVVNPSPGQAPNVIVPANNTP